MTGVGAPTDDRRPTEGGTRATDGTAVAVVLIMGGSGAGVYVDPLTFLTSTGRVARASTGTDDVAVLTSPMRGG